jgi:hypothetical protein
MPTLNWIGRKAVENHHRQVLFHLLKEVPDLSVGDPGTGNLLVEGDNLLALKALLPYYAGQIKCIYIDPPYNTGEENWIYNDSVNSPEIREWLGNIVGGNAEATAQGFSSCRAGRIGRRSGRRLVIGGAYSLEVPDTIEGGRPCFF